MQARRGWRVVVTVIGRQERMIAWSREVVVEIVRNGQILELLWRAEFATLDTGHKRKRGAEATSKDVAWEPEKMDFPFAEREMTGWILEWRAKSPVGTF